MFTDHRPVLTDFGIANAKEGTAPARTDVYVGPPMPGPLQSQPMGVLFHHRPTSVGLATRLGQTTITAFQGLEIADPERVQGLAGAFEAVGLGAHGPAPLGTQVPGEGRVGVLAQQVWARCLPLGRASVLLDLLGERIDDLVIALASGGDPYGLPKGRVGASPIAQSSLIRSMCQPQGHRVGGTDKAPQPFPVTVPVRPKADVDGHQRETEEPRGAAPGFGRREPGTVTSRRYFLIQLPSESTCQPCTSGS